MQLITSITAQNKPVILDIYFQSFQLQSSGTYTNFSRNKFLGEKLTKGSWRPRSEFPRVSSVSDVFHAGHKTRVL